MELLVDSCGLGSDSLHAGVPFNSKVDLVIISKEFGLIVGLKISKDPKISEEKKLLDARKHFLDLTMEFGEISVSPLFILEDDKKSVISDKYKNYVVANEDTKKGNWVRDLIDPMQSPLTVEVFQGLIRQIFPEVVYLPARNLSDDYAEINDRRRIQLDHEQTSIARLPVYEFLQITGGAGTGKTVVLVSRIQHFLASNPTWKVLFLCYTNSLKRDLQELVSHDPRVDVKAVWELPKSLSQTYEAIFVDEGQDLTYDEWKRIAKALIPSRGGLTVASDDPQAIFDREPAANRAITRFTKVMMKKKIVKLEQMYRSTKQIFEVALTASGVDDSTTNCLIEGNPVQLISAATPEDQSNCVAYEIANLRDKNMLPYDDIGILYIDRYFFDNNLYENHLTRALDRNDIPYRWEKAGESVGDDGKGVAVVTIHSAKGREFGLLFIVGLEKLKTFKIPDASNFAPVAPERETLNARLVYVALTRARNTLVLLFSKPNFVVGRLIEHKFVEQVSWPGDYPDDAN